MRLPGETTDTIFYMPSEQRYGEIAIDPDRGERMLCADDEAILAR